MEIRKNGIIIGIQQVDGFGKRPGLWIGAEKPFMLVKVASFSNNESAKKFGDWLDYIIGFSNDKSKLKLDK